MLNPEDCRDRTRSFQRLAMEVTEGEGKDHFFAVAQSGIGWPQISKGPRLHRQHGRCAAHIE